MSKDEIIYTHSSNCLGQINARSERGHRQTNVGVK